MFGWAFNQDFRFFFRYPANTMRSDYTGRARKDNRRYNIATGKMSIRTVTSFKMSASLHGQLFGNLRLKHQSQGLKGTQLP